MAHTVPRITHMEKRQDEVANAFEHALADEILAEVARQRRTSKSVQDESGVRARAWSNYLTTRNRHLPMPAVVAICDALGIRTSEMLRRAEDRMAKLDPIEAELLEGLTERSRAVVDRGRGADSVDPNQPASERTRRAG